MTARLRTGLPSAGLFAGPVAWMVSTQANYALVPWICASGLQLVPLVAAALAAASLFGGFLSWRAWTAAKPEAGGDPSAGGSPHRFVAAVGMLTATLFALVILLQGAAGLVLQGCER
jgi:hypothetical protein